MVKLRRSNSLSELSYDDFRFGEDVDGDKEREEELERKQHENNCRLKYTASVCALYKLVT